VSQYRLMTEGTCYRFSGVAGREGFSPQQLILRVMEGVARQEGYWVEKTVGWNVKPSPSHMELQVDQAYPFRCHEVCRQEVILA
jgi:hypothetical protein